MRFAHVDQHHIGFLADLQRAEIIRAAQRAGGIDGGHLQHLARRQDRRVAEVAAVIMHRLRHVAEHVIAPVRCGGVGAERHGDAPVDHLRRRAAAEDRHDGAGVMGHGGAGLLQCLDVLFGQIDAMRQEGMRPQQPQRAGIGNGAVAVAVLGEQHVMPGAQVADRFGHPPHLGFGHLPPVVAAIDRHDEADAGAGIQQIVMRRDQRLADLELSHETDRDGRAVRPVIGQRKRRPVRTHRQHRAKARIAGGGAMGGAKGRVVGAIDIGATAQQGDTGGHPAHQPLEQREPRFGGPEAGPGRAGIKPRAGVEPGRDIAGPQGPHQPVTGMGMTVDQAGNGHPAPRLDHLARPVGQRRQFGVGSDGGDPVGLDGDGGILNHPSVGIDGQRGDMADQDIGHAGAFRSG